ncbi:hypothetical protein [Cyanobium sp. FACHB-13342]|uniref:hypothetical protein n=1 Tax=Cyanobium sp. FACHB-13342 TaxID=2692793 RepID=UPI001680BE28|nr:hypothetical protein [Cyanobium sp. FACHB-13342]MBD2423189.1 hypothetical protein [Cyanobium sp. FACHB-13342]
MAWEPSVLRKYNTTGHFRLLNQLRSELKANPLVRPKEGQSVGEVNRSKALIRAIEGRSQGYGRGRRSGASQSTVAASAPQAPPQAAQEPTWTAGTEGAGDDGAGSASFRERLNAVELR